MNETEKVAIINICKEIQFNIEKADPADKKTIAQLNEIHNKSEVFENFQFFSKIFLKVLCSIFIKHR